MRRDKGRFSPRDFIRELRSQRIHIDKGAGRQVTRAERPEQLVSVYCVHGHWAYVCGARSLWTRERNHLGRVGRTGVPRKQPNTYGNSSVTA
jgi:hypothetical protein